MFRTRRFKKLGKGVKLTSRVKQARQKVKVFNATKRKLKTLESKLNKSSKKIQTLENKLRMEQDKKLYLLEEISDENQNLDYYKRELTYSEMAM